MAPKKRHTPPFDDAQRYDFAFAQLQNLATKDVADPLTGEHVAHIDLKHIYGGNGYNLEMRDAPLSVRYGRLTKALEKPGKADEPKVSAPLRAGKILLSPPEIFDRLCQDEHYPYFRLDMDMLAQYAALFAEWIHDNNLFEPCGGFCVKMHRMLTQAMSKNRRPRRIIINDTEEMNLEHGLSSMGDILHSYSSTPLQSIPELIGVRGDWLKNSTYLLSNCVTKPEWPSLQDNILKALRDDPDPTVVYLPGAMANDFLPSSFLRFLHKRFKPGTLFIIGYDGTENRKFLSYYYKKHPLVQQLALSGLTHACWDNLGEQYADYFDPRLVGISVDPIPWGKGSNVQISAFTKDQPDRRLPLTPIIKLSRQRYTKLIRKAGFRMVGVLSPSPEAQPKYPTDYVTLAFTHQGHGGKFKKIFRRTMLPASVA